MLRISARSYFDQEHGKYGYLALSLMFYLASLKDDEIVRFVRDFIIEVEDAERKTKLNHPLVYYRVNERLISEKRFADNK